MNKTEVDYYPEIQKKFTSLLKSELGPNYEIYSEIGELTKGLKKIIDENKITNKNILDFYGRLCPLKLDIFFIAINKKSDKFALLILEIKLLDALGLNQLSQLIGYTLVSNAQMGLLINIDKGLSKGFAGILDANDDLTNIKREYNGGKSLHKLGVFQYDSLTGKLIPNPGRINSFSYLVTEIRKLTSD
ncbi:MAG: hypothetical protein ABIF85_00765 [Nanoarchaeota archaeon]